MMNKADIFFKALNNAKKYRDRRMKTACLVYLIFAEEARLTGTLAY